ncbi:MAG: hypothetical protein ACHBN1_17365 [Heteroscytonema crispum UTEX LB 1556]
MFYIQVVQKHWDKTESPTKKSPRTSKLSSVKEINKKNAQFAKAKTDEYISNIQQVYYLERRMFC